MEHMKYVHKDPNASGVPGNLAKSILLEKSVVELILILCPLSKAPCSQSPLPCVR